MVKSELIARVASKFRQLTESDIELGINQILECMSDSLSNGNRVELRNFGSFSLHHHSSRNAHNPRTGKKVITSPKCAPHFKPGKEFRTRVNESRLQNIPIINDEIEEAEKTEKNGKE